MKKVISVILAVAVAFGCFCFTGVIANAEYFETESGVKVTIADVLYKSADHTMQFPGVEDYNIKQSSDEGDYAISKDINDLGYTIVFPAGTTKADIVYTLDSEGEWFGFGINPQANSGYWDKDENGEVDFTKPVTFVRNEEKAEQDDYGILYRNLLWGKGVKGFNDYDKIYWKLIYECNGETYTDTFDVALADYIKPDIVTVKAFNYNVSGLPIINKPSQQDVSAAFIVEKGYDIVAVQEDFNFHNRLVRNLHGYEYMTNHTGGVPGGDGLNIFTKSMPIYNETRVMWNDSCGVIAYGADELTPKGFIYTVIDIGNGIYVDFYNLHADAFSDEGSIEAREKQYKQVVEFINARYAENERPVIVTGDFNTYMHSCNYDSDMYTYFQEQCGLKDAWNELHNDGDYFDYQKWYDTGISSWGNWDSVERFMYKSGGGVDVIATSYEYVEVLDENGEPVSDHCGAECEFNFIKTADFTENTQNLEVVTTGTNTILRTVEWILKDLINVFTHLDQIIVLIAPAN